MSKPAATAVAEPAPTFEPALIIFGLDEAKKAHASTFAADEVELAMRAAGIMRMFTLPVAGDECRKLALGLARGRVFSSGRAFCPFAKKPAYEALVALGGVVPPAPEPVVTTPTQPEALAMWPSTGLATSWETLAVGELVLAPETGEYDGWFEAVVVELKLENLVIMRWHRWPGLPAFPRHVGALGLLHPSVPGVDPVINAIDVPVETADSNAGVAAVP